MSGINNCIAMLLVFNTVLSMYEINDIYNKTICKLCDITEKIGLKKDQG